MQFRAVFSYLALLNYSLLGLWLCFFPKLSAQDSSANKDLLPKFPASFNQAQVSFVVQELGMPNFTLSYDADKKLMPASNLKILTTYLSLKYLPDTLTGFYYKSNQDTLYILPTGDPTLLHPAFSRASLLYFFTKLNNKIKYISLNSRAWQAEPFGKGWIWDDYPYYFMAESSVMPFYSNLINFRLNKTSNKKNRPSFTITPFLYSSTPLKIDFSKLKKLGRYYTIARAPHQNLFFIEREKSPFIQAYVPIITNNTEFAEKVLNKLTGRKILLSKQEITLDNTWQAFRSQNRNLVLHHMMTNSDNFVAEQLLLMISRQKLGYMHRDSIIEYLYSKELKPLFGTDTAVWVDGSGLSVYNRFSARQINTLLGKTYALLGNMRKIGTIYGHANNGTLKDYFPSYEAVLFAKTGSMSHTFCLSGFFLGSKSQKWYSFSLLINNLIMPASKIKRQVEKYLSQVIQML